MYTVYLDGELLYHPNIKERSIEKTKLSFEVNKTNSFKFTVRNTNKLYSKIYKMKSIVSVYDDNYRLFRGRVLNATKGFFNELQVTCEGELAFLLDSTVRPYEFTGSVVEYITFLVEQHNNQVTEEKHFRVGNVTVKDSNDYITRANSDYPNTWDELNDKCVKLLGGYLWTREEDDGIYIDYLEEFTLTNAQRIRFGENLLDLEETIKGQDIATAIIPLGAKIVDEDGNETNERLTIASYNGGIDYVFEESAVERYGWIYKVVKFDDVTVASNLYAKGREELQKYVNLKRVIELRAIDLHKVDINIQAFRFGRYTIVESAPHDLSEAFLTRKLELNLLDPKDGLLTLGDEKATFVDKHIESNKQTQDNVVKVQASVTELQNKTHVDLSVMESSIVAQITGVKSNCKEIIFSALESYAKTGDLEEYKQTVEAQLQILASDIVMKFSEASSKITDVDGDLRETTTKLEKYFDFSLDNGLIIRTGEGNEMQLKLDNDVIAFMKNGVQFGWWDGINFHTGNIVVEVNERAQFGNFAFVPRKDGSLMFLKVSDVVTDNYGKIGMAIVGQSLVK